MKILILSRYQNTINRGAESFVSELAKRLSDNHQVAIFSGQDSDNFGKIIKGNFNIVIPINGRLQSLKASLGRLFSNYKVLITGHSGMGRDDIWNIIIVRPDIFVALTDYMANWASKWVWGTKVIKIPNGIDLEKFKSTGQKTDLELPAPIILSVGALTWYKHHERVIKAVSKLENASLLIVGKGEKEEELKKLGKKLLGSRFKIKNFDYDQMPAIYRSVNLFTLPSWDREAFGLVYLEALASNLPVVAPNDLARQEIVGEGGLLADVSNIAEYAKTMERALKKHWDNKPRYQAEKFSWDEVAGMYNDAINSVFKKPG